MDSQLGNAIQKRKHDEDNSDENKRKKLETPETPAEGDGVTKLTDVIDDCLEHIFKYLTLQDLINIAETCKRFQSSVKLAFAAKCNKKLMRLRPKHSSFQPVILIGNAIEIRDISICLKILRHFGSMITKLDVYYYFLIQNQSAELARYTNEYCADSLIDINIYGATELVMANWTKPFPKVESIKISGSDLGDLKAWFPKIRRMVLYDFKFITNNFPHLEELTIHTITDEEKVKKMLRLNPNLQKLCLPRGLNMKFMASVSKYMQSLRFLDIDCDHGFFNQEVPPIHLKNVEEFHVKISSDCHPMPKIPLSFDQLENLQLTAGIKTIRRIDNLMNFIRQNPSLTKLSIYVKYEFNTLEAEVEQIKMGISTEFEWLDVEMKQITCVPAHVPSSIHF